MTRMSLWAAASCMACGRSSCMDGGRAEERAISERGAGGGGPATRTPSQAAADHVKEHVNLELEHVVLLGQLAVQLAQLRGLACCLSGLEGV